MAGPAPFRCNCGKITGEAKAVPDQGNHLVCYCASCRAGALYCEDGPAEGEPVDLYLTPPHNITLTEGRDHLAAFAFSPKGILRWKATCCGVQMFSSQPNPKTAFMSVRAERFADPQQLGPVKSKAFVPKKNGKTGQEGIGPLARLIFRAIVARVTGKWRETPLYDPTTGKPISDVTLISKADKRALLAANP